MNGRAQMLTTACIIRYVSSDVSRVHVDLRVRELWNGMCRRFHGTVARCIGPSCLQGEGPYIAQRIRYYCYVIV